MIKNNGNELFKDKKIEFVCNLTIDDEKSSVEFPLTEIKINNSIFSGEGRINYKEHLYKMLLKANNTNFKTILPLLPNSVSQSFTPYKSEGEAHFNLTIEKNNQVDSSPKIDINFGCKNVSLREPKTNINFTNISFLGSFTNGDKKNNLSSVLTFKNLKGKFENHIFEGELKYENFDNPHIETYFKGELPLSFLLQFNKNNKIKNVKGTLNLDVKIKALQEDLINNRQEKINSSGQIEIKNINLENDNAFYNFKNLNGIFVFNKSDIAFSDFTGQINNSDFKLNGYLHGFFDYFFNKKGKISAFAQLQSNTIDFNHLIETSSQNDTLVEIDNEYLRNISFNLDANVKMIKWGKFNFKNSSGTLKHNNLLFTAPKIIAEIGGGGFNISGSLDSRNKKNILLNVNTSINGIKIDSIFYYFNNFNEDFITYNNLKGQLYLNSTTTLSLNKYLNLVPKTLTSDLDIKIKNGKLVDFEPMQNLSKFIDEESLKNIYFDELSDQIHIENEKINIPELKINSSVSNIKLKGTHTFDQHFYYQLKIPIKNLNPTKKIEAESAYEEGKDGPILHLIISGTTDNYIIKFDKKATSEIIKTKVKEEIKDIKEVIKGTYKEEEKEQISLEDEDFFEFESDSIDN